MNNPDTPSALDTPSTQVTFSWVWYTVPTISVGVILIGIWTLIQLIYTQCTRNRVARRPPIDVEDHIDQSATSTTNTTIQA